MEVERKKRNIKLSVNLDMIGCIMEKFLACCTSEKKMVHYISYMSQGVGFGVDAYQRGYSSNKTGEQYAKETILQKSG